MPELDAATVERVQGYWKSISAEIPARFNEDLSEIRDILKNLEEMGLDIEADETYGLMAPGLTREAFDQRHTYLAMLWIIDSYHMAMQLRHDYINVQASRRAYGLGEIMERRFPYYERCLAKAEVPADAAISPATLRDFEYIKQLHDDGTLEQEWKHACMEAAKDSMRSAYSYMQAVEGDRCQDRNRLCKEGLSYAKSTLDYIAKAGEFYRPGRIPSGYHAFGGWEDGTIEFSRAKAEEMKTAFLLKGLQSDFNTAVRFQEQGHFVLDVSGGGYGMNQMPMQEIAGKLQEYGYDLTDPATYEKIGTDRQTFRERYRREREEVSRNEDFSNLVKPALNL